MNPTVKSGREQLPASIFLKQALLICGAALVVTVKARAGNETGETVAIAAKVSDDYVRVKLPGGAYQPESYAFGEGGTYGPHKNASIDRLKFIDVARVISVPLAGQNYLPSHDPNQTKLLIMVYWGTTTGAREDPALHVDPAQPADGSVLDHHSVLLAPILGYEDALADGFRYRGTALEFVTKDYFEELEYNRYFVVLMAYDFQLLWKQKKAKLLWETRFSIPENRNAFDEQLPTMALNASKYFGRDSKGLKHRAPVEHVDLGELKFLEPEPAKTPTPDHP